MDSPKKRSIERAKVKIGDHYNSQTLSRVKAPTWEQRAVLEKSMKRHIQKQAKGNSDSAKNLRGKINYFGHLSDRARRRGEED